MGSRREYAYKKRQAQEGRICPDCGRYLKGDPVPGRRCDECAKLIVHRVYMSFFYRDGWYCQFQEQDLKTPLPKKLNFASSKKVVELARRGGAFKNLESRQAIEQGIEKGRGGVYLELTEDQYQALKRR